MIHKKVLRFLKHTFVPHHENDYKPHFFREHVILSLLIGSILLLLLSFTTYFIIRTTALGSSVISTVLTDLTNQTRKEHNLPPLRNNYQLFTAATLKGNDMNSRQYFSHFAPDGTSPWHWFNQVGYEYTFAGENLAVNFRNSKAVEKAWLASPKHRDNILDDRYREIGIATVPGTSGTKPVIFVVQLFGTQDPQAFPPSLSQVGFVENTHSFEKVLFDASHYINIIYITLTVILIMALLMMIFIEIRKQHYLHILTGVLLVIVVLICIAINSLLL